MPKRKRYSPSQTWLRALSGAMAVAFIWTNVLFAQRANPSFWEERRNVVAQFIERRSTAQGNSTAMTPDGFGKLTTGQSGNYNLLAQLPTLQTSIADRAKNWNSSVSPPLMGQEAKWMLSYKYLGKHHFLAEARSLSRALVEGQGEGIGRRELNVAGLLPAILASIAPYAEIREISSASLAPSPVGNGLKPFPTVVIIQDIHQHYEAQKNIANVINVVAQFTGGEALSSFRIERRSTTPDKSGNYSNSVFISTSTCLNSVVIGVEGAVGAFDFSPYRVYSDKKLTEDIADFFMRQGMIGGPEFYGITAPDDKVVPMIGVEDEKLYLANIKAFKDSLPLERQVKIDVNKRQVEMKIKKEKAFNTTLLELDKKREAYHESKLNLGEYLTFLKNTATTPDGFGKLTTGKSGNYNDHNERNNTITQKRYNAVLNLVEAYHIEKSLNIPKLESERSQILDTLADKLPKSSLDKLLNSALAYRTNAITYAQFYSYFKEDAKRAGIALSQFPEMDKYVRYVQLADSIDKNKLFSEIEQLENHLENKLTKTEEEQEAKHSRALVKLLLQESKYLELVKKLVEFSLTPEEWNKYKSLCRSVVAQFIERRLNATDNSTATTPDKSGNYTDTTNAITPSPLKSFEQFYETALKRNEVFVSNLLASTLTSTYVLIAGGFHTNGITQLLKQKNIPYVVLAPNITKVEEGQKSLELLARAKTPLEKLFSGEKIFMVAPLATNPIAGYETKGETITGTNTLLHLGGAEDLEQSLQETKNIESPIQIIKAHRDIFGLFQITWVWIKQHTSDKLTKVGITWTRAKVNHESIKNLPTYKQVVGNSTPLISGELASGDYFSMYAIKPGLAMVVAILAGKFLKQLLPRQWPFEFIEPLTTDDGKIISLPGFKWHGLLAEPWKLWSHMMSEGANQHPSERFTKITAERVIRTVKRREGTKLLKAQLMSINPHEPGKFSDIEFETKVNKSGTIYIKLANVPGKKEKIKATLRTGSERPGIVKIARKWVPEKNEYRVYTSRKIDGEMVLTESRIVRHPDYPHLSILNQTYPGEEGLNALAIQLTSKTPNVPGLFPDLDFDDAGANDRGQILIYLGQFSGERINATVSTGATEPGSVKIERFSASLLGKYIMKTTREINGRTIVKFFHIVPFTKHPGLWKWEGFDYDKALEKAKQLEAEAIKSGVLEEPHKTFNNDITMFNNAVAMKERIKRIFNLSLNMALELIPTEIKETGISAEKLSRYYANLTWTQQELELAHRLHDSIDNAKTSYETAILEIAPGLAGRNHDQAQAYLYYFDSLLQAVKKIIEQAQLRDKIIKAVSTAADSFGIDIRNDDVIVVRGQPFSELDEFRKIIPELPELTGHESVVWTTAGRILIHEDTIRGWQKSQLDFENELIKIIVHARYEHNRYQLFKERGKPITKEMLKQWHEEAVNREKIVDIIEAADEKIHGNLTGKEIDEMNQALDHGISGVMEFTKTATDKQRKAIVELMALNATRTTSAQRVIAQNILMQLSEFGLQEAIDVQKTIETSIQGNIGVEPAEATFSSVFPLGSIIKLEGLDTVRHPLFFERLAKTQEFKLALKESIDHIPEANSLGTEYGIFISPVRTEGNDLFCHITMLKGTEYTMGSFPDSGFLIHIHPLTLAKIFDSEGRLQGINFKSLQSLGIPSSGDSGHLSGAIVTGTRTTGYFLMHYNFLNDANRDLYISRHASTNFDISESINSLYEYMFQSQWAKVYKLSPGKTEYSLEEVSYPSLEHATTWLMTNYQTLLDEFEELELKFWPEMESPKQRGSEQSKYDTSSNNLFAPAIWAQVSEQAIKQLLSRSGASYVYELSEILVNDEALGIGDPVVYLDETPGSGLTNQAITNLRKDSENFTVKIIEGQAVLIPDRWVEWLTSESGEALRNAINYTLTQKGHDSLNPGEPLLIIPARHILKKDNKTGKVTDHLAGDCIANNAVVLHESLPAVVASLNTNRLKAGNMLLQLLIEHELRHEAEKLILKPKDDIESAENDFAKLDFQRLRELAGSQAIALANILTGSTKIVADAFQEDMWTAFRTPRVKEDRIKLKVTLDPSIVEALIDALKDENTAVRDAAILALVDLDELAIPYLVAALNSNNWVIRYNAGRALVKLGRLSVPALIAALEDEEFRRQDAVVLVLSEIADSQAIEPILKVVLKGKTGQDRSYAASKLDRFDPKLVRKAIKKFNPKVKVLPRDRKDTPNVHVLVADYFSTSEEGHGNQVIARVRHVLGKDTTVNVEPVLGLSRSRPDIALDKIEEFVDSHPNSVFIVNVSDMFEDTLDVAGFMPPERIKRLGKKGVIFVLAAGNSKNMMVMPEIDNVLYVASADPRTGRKTSYSVYGPHVYVAADPGQESGTSFSAPLVTAELAKILNKHKRLSLPKAIKLLRKRARPMEKEPLWQMRYLGTGSLQQLTSTPRPGAHSPIDQGPVTLGSDTKPKSVFLTLITMGAWIFGLWLLGNHSDLQIGLALLFGLGAFLDPVMQGFGVINKIFGLHKFQLHDAFKDRAPPEKWWRLADNIRGKIKHANTAFLQHLPLWYQKFLVHRETFPLQRLSFGGDFLTHIFIDPLFVMTALLDSIIDFLKRIKLQSPVVARQTATIGDTTGHFNFPGVQWQSPILLMSRHVKKTMPQKNDRRVNLSDKINYSDDIKSDYEKYRIERLLENLKHFPESGLQIQRIDVRREYDTNNRKIYEINFIGSAEKTLAPPVALKIYEPFIESVKIMKKYARNSKNTANKLARKNRDIAPKEVRALTDIDPSTGKRLVALRKEYIAGSNIEDMIRAAASSEEKHRLAVKGLAAYLAMHKALGYLIEDADPENVVIEAITEQAKIIDFEVPTKKLKESEALDLLSENWKFIFAREDEFLEAFGEAARQVYGQEANRFLKKAGIFSYFMERLQEHLYELKPPLAVLKYLLIIFDGAHEKDIFSMEENVTKMLKVYGKIQSFLNKHLVPEKLETTLLDSIGNILLSFSLLFPLSQTLDTGKRVIPEGAIQKLKQFNQPLVKEIKWIDDIIETRTFAQPDKEYYEERALGEMLRIFPTLTPVSLEYISSEFPGITPERIKEMMGSAGFYTRTGKEKATGKTVTYLKPESLGAAVRLVSHPDTERSEDESALRRTIREEMGKVMSETKVNLLSDFEPFELKERISELPEEHRGSGNIWYMVRLADFFSAARSKKQTRRFQSGPIYKKELSRVLFFMTGEELSELVKVAEDWHDSEQEMDDDSFAAFAEKLFRIQGSSFALAKETGRQEAMDFEQMFSAFGRLTGFIAPEIQLGQKLKEKLKPLWEYGTKLPGQLKKSRLLKTRDFIKKDKSWSGVRLFDVSNISEDTLTQMWTNIKMVKGKIAIGLMTDKAVLGKDDIENIKESLRSRWKNMSEQNRPDFDKMLKDVHFGEIIVTAADLMKNEHAESPLVEINPDVLYKVTRDKAKNLFGNTKQIPVQLFTPNPFRFKLSWKEEALQILAIVTAIQILEIGNKTEDAIRQIAAASKQA